MTLKALVAGTQYGTIAWALDGTTQVYAAGQVISLDLRVSNPTGADRDYRLDAGLYDPDTGTLISGTEAIIQVAGADTFTVTANSYRDIAALVTLNRTDVVLGISLYDVAEAGVDDMVSAHMVSEVPSPISQMMPAMMTIVMVGLMAAMMAPLVRGL